MTKIEICTGVYWIEIPEIDLRILCGCPADVVKLLINRGLIIKTEKNGVTYETGPNAILLSDVMIQNGHLSNLAEFPVLQMLYRQGMLLPNHPNNTGRKPMLIGLPEILDAQSEYIRRGNYGLTSVEEIVSAGISRPEADELLKIKLNYAFGEIKETADLIKLMPVEGDATHIGKDVFLHRLGVNRYEFIFQGDSISIDLNLPPNVDYDSSYQLGMHQVSREYFSVIHNGEGDGWDVNRPCMASILTFQGKIFLIDAGPGLMSNLAALGISVGEIEGIFQTHAHDDHFAGIASLIRSDSRIKYFSAPLVRASVQKKLAALMSIEESDFSGFFEIHDLALGEWNNIEGLEVKPAYSPHPVETTILTFRTQWGEGYKKYSHIADISGFDVLKKMVVKERFEQTRKAYLESADLKKIDAGGGMIHGKAEDFSADDSDKILLAHSEHPLSSAQREIGSNAYFGMQDTLVPAPDDGRKEQALGFLRTAYPDVPDYELRMLASYPVEPHNAGSIIVRGGTACTSVLLLVSGVAEFIEHKSGIANRLSAGSIIGEPAALHKTAYTGTFRAISYVMVLSFPVGHYANFIDRNNLRAEMGELIRRRTFLQKSRFFGESISFQVLNSIAIAMESRTIAKGMPVEFVDNKKLLIVESGGIELRNNSRMIDRMASGDLCGETCIFMHGRSLFSAVTTEQTNVFDIPADIIQSIPMVRWKLLETLRRRMRLLTAQITLEWRPEYSVNVDAIDAQHQQLFEMATSLIAIYEKDGVNKKLLDTFDSLIAVASDHFKAEEQYLSEIQYPELDAHAQSHKKLTSTLRKFPQTMLKDEGNLSETIRFMIKSWLVTHVLREDGGYKRFQEIEAESA